MTGDRIVGIRREPDELSGPDDRGAEAGRQNGTTSRSGASSVTASRSSTAPR